MNADTDDDPCSGWCEYRPPVEVDRETNGDMPTFLVQSDDGLWRLDVDGAFADNHVFEGSAGWSPERAAHACDEYLREISTPRLSEWVPAKPEGLHAHVLFDHGIPACFGCGAFVFGGTEVTVPGVADDEPLVVCAKELCVESLLSAVRLAQKPSVVSVPLFPGVSA